MTIYDFDVTFRFDKIRLNLSYVNTIKDSISENRRLYREFAEQNLIEFNALQECCDTFERTILIDAYTYVEQLVKNFYYELIGKDKHENSYLCKFINEKIPVEKFSPKIKFKEIESGIRSELTNDFKFILNPNKSEVIMYDEMVKSRHRYAHTGEYFFDYTKFKDVLIVIEYISNELSMVTREGIKYRAEFQNLVRETLKLSSKANSLCKNNGNNVNKIRSRECFRELKNHCVTVCKTCGKQLSEYALLSSSYEKIEEFSQVDLRCYANASAKSVELFNELSQNIIPPKKNKD